MREALQGLEQVLVTTTVKITSDLQNNLFSMVDYVKVLGLEQEKLTEKVTLQSQQSQDLVQLSNDARELKALALPNNSALGLGGANLATLQAKIWLLESRLLSDLKGRLGGELFQSRVDVLLFVEKNVPSNAFYLYHDAVTLLESLSSSYVERKDVLQEWYQSTKFGVKKAAAHHMASFRLTLPMVFGRIKEGRPGSGKHHLPAVKTFKECYTFDGISGIKSYISQGMEDLKYQLRQDIDQTFGSEALSKARLLAMEMHELAQNFVMELSTWMDSFYQELIYTSEATEDEAWEVVWACGKRVFEMLRVPRAQASNATMGVSPSNQCASYLWALVQAHKSMQEFIETRFQNHGAIAPVIVLHNSYFPWSTVKEVRGMLGSS